MYNPIQVVLLLAENLLIEWLNTSQEFLKNTQAMLADSRALNSMFRIHNRELDRSACWKKQVYSIEEVILDCRQTNQIKLAANSQ